MEFKLNTHCIPKAAIQSIFLQNMLQCDVLAQEVSDGKRGLQKPVAEVGVFWWLGFFFSSLSFSFFLARSKEDGNSPRQKVAKWEKQQGIPTFSRKAE